MQRERNLTPSQMQPEYNLTNILLPLSRNLAYLYKISAVTSNPPHYVTEILFRFFGQSSLNINRLCRCLFMHCQIFQKSLITVYFSKQTFILSNKYLEKFPYPHPIHNIYTLFTQKWQVKMIAGSHDFQNVFRILEDAQKALNQLKDTEAMQILNERSIKPSFSLIKHVSELACHYKLQVECFKLINELVRLSFSSVNIESVNMKQHKIKIQFDYSVLTLIKNLVGCLNFKDGNTKKLLSGLIFMYINEKQSQLEDQFQFHGYCWYTLPEKILGIVLMSYYIGYGSTETKQIFDKIFDQKICQAIIQELLKSYEIQGALLRSTAVDESQSFVDVVEGVLQNPYNLLFDSDMLCLQMFSILADQELFVKYVFENLAAPFRLQFLLSLAAEQSYFINVAESCGFKNNPMVQAAMSLQIINAYNTHNRRKMTASDLAEYFDNTILDLRVINLENSLVRVADYHQQAFLLKLQHQSFTFVEPTLLMRDRKSWDMLKPFLSHITLDQFQKHGLLRKQNQDNLYTFCYAVTQALSKSILFMSNTMGTFLRELWGLNDAEIKRQGIAIFIKIKILQIFLLRNTANPEFLNFANNEVQFIKNHQAKSKTRVQQVLIQLLNLYLSDFNQKTVRNSMDRTLHRTDSQSSKKRLFDGIRQRRNLFLQEVDTDCLITTTKQCVICQAKDDLTHIGIRIFHVSTHKLTSSLCFDTCHHKFHMKCLGGNTEVVCPQCKIPYVLILPELYKTYTFFKKRTISLKIDCQKNKLHNEIVSKDCLQKMKKILQLQTLEPSILEDMLVSRLHLSIQLEPSQFQKHYYDAAKTLFCLYIFLTNQTRRNTHIVKEQINNEIVVNDQVIMMKMYEDPCQAYRNLLCLMIRMGSIFDSIQCDKLYKRIVNKYFNALLTLHINKHFSENFRNFQDFRRFFKFKENVLLGNLIEFARATYYAYSMVYEVTEQEMEGIDLILKNSDFFQVQPQMIWTLLFMINSNLKIDKNIKTLLQHPSMIDLPQTYKQFHSLYYNRQCNICGQYPIISCSSLMCLLCGFRFCNYECQYEQQMFYQDLENVTDVGRQHSQEHHGSTIFINIESTEVILIDGYVKAVGMLYRRKVGKWSPQRNLDWSQIVINRPLFNKLNALLRNRQIYNEIVQKNTSQGLIALI